jgi:phage terminase Nu1 subunit (DNA packaging protein)
MHVNLRLFAGVLQPSAEGNGCVLLWHSNQGIKMKAVKATRSDNVDAAELGHVLGISRASIANLATDGVLPRAGRGLFNLPSSVQAYIRHKLLQAGATDLGTKSLVTERSRLAKFKADKAEREGQLESGELIPAGEVEAGWLTIVNNARTKLLVIPTKLAPRVTTCTAVEAERLMRKEFDAALTEIAATPV